MPRVSVIIPTYNRCRLVKEAVRSVLRQTLCDFEVIVVDDGSTDDTGRVIRAVSDDRVKYIYKDNAGPASARNVGMAHSKAEYLGFLESDDLWPEDFLATMVSRLEDNPEYGGAYCPFKDTYPGANEVVAFGKDRYMSGWLTRDFFERTPFIIPSATLFRRSAWQGVWWDEALRSCDDIDAFLRICTQTKVLCVPDVCIIRRVTSDSLTSGNTVSISPIATLIFERFYFDLAGHKYVPARLARRRFSRMYRGMARQHHRAGNRRAAIMLFKKAIDYYPFDLKNYKWLLKSLLLSAEKDKMPDWQMPKPLPPHITVTNSIQDSNQSQ